MSLWILLPLTVLALAALALYLHHLFEGECLPADLWREWKLARMDLATLDRRWEKAERSEIVVTLTTTPSRIALLEPTLKSLLDQTRPPARITLNLPRHSTRENRAYEIPAPLNRLASLQIRRCDDLGPGTKLIPSVQAEPPDTPLVVVDDDRIYPPWLLARYERAAAAQPDRALTMAGWVAPPDLVDRMTTIRANLFMRPPAPIRASRLRKPRRVDIFQGVMSYLVRPRFFDEKSLADFTGQPPELRFVDDVRSSALCRAEIWVIPAPSLSFVPRAQAALLQQTRLGLVNRVPGERHNRNNTIALKHFADRWQVGGPR
ncbi:hypothetical protein P1J78_02060 [Psychromarinibacter sp. C21-152]|uniref:Uncharacterized protein n=1 Tax=Psychromarinibacter sediminicola TaxID=3033385 RepID=A0AAE3NPX4_9RHOB|nr:hypothetical protein [Psychromarinibacter sediminicola]MDF0599504.1 hypothetical protein [Psychromarinibacter sediminicola]